MHALMHVRMLTVLEKIVRHNADKYAPSCGSTVRVRGAYVAGEIKVTAGVALPIAVAPVLDRTSRET